MIDTIYNKTKGWKTIIGFVIAFVAYGLAGVKLISPDQAKQVETLGTYLIAFGLGDKAATKLG